MTVFELASQLMSVAAVDTKIEAAIWDPITAEFIEVGGVDLVIRNDKPFIVIEVEGEKSR